MGAAQDPAAISALDLCISIPCMMAGIGGRRRPSAVAAIGASEEGAGVSVLARPGGFDAYFCVFFAGRKWQVSPLRRKP